MLLVLQILIGRDEAEIPRRFGATEQLTIGKGRPAKLKDRFDFVVRQERTKRRGRALIE